MIMNDAEITERLNSPMNLINKLSQMITAPVVPLVDRREYETQPSPILSFPNRDTSRTQIVGLPPSADSLIGDFHNKVNQNLAADGALDVLVQSVERLKQLIPDVESPKDLSRIAGDMGKVITAMRPPSEERSGNQQQVIIFKPIINNESHYETLVVAE